MMTSFYHKMIRLSVLFLLTPQFTVGSPLGVPISTWPLYYVRPADEIKTMGESDTCPVTKGNFHASLNYNAVYLKGLTTSFVDLDITDNTVSSDDFSLAVFVKAKSADEGAIFHYKTDQCIPPNDCIAEILLVYNATHIILTVLTANGRNLGTVQSALDVTNYKDIWTGFAVAYDYSNGKVEVFVEAKLRADVVIPSKPNIGQPGNIRVGASFDESSPGLLGDVICFTLFHSKVKDADFNIIVKKCSKSKWSSEVLLPTCEGDGGFFEIVQDNTAVDSTYSVLSNHVTGSRIKCAGHCQKTEDCESFTLDASTGTCSLYDDDYTTSTVPSNGVKYYKRRTCC